MSIRLRPRFRLRVDLEPDAVMELFARRKKAGNLPCVLHLYERQVEIGVRPAVRHFWSPYLYLHIESRDGETSLNGKYGPNINAWTMFLAAYAVLFITGTGGLFVATSQMQLNQPKTGLWIVAACGVLAALIYAIGLMGRRLAHPQMVVIHEFVESLFADHILAIESFRTN